MNRMVKRVSWKWDRAAGVLWAAVSFDDGQTAAVGIPLAQVVATFDQTAAEIGLALPPFVGSIESVDGLFSSIKSVTKSVGKLAKKAVKQTTKRLGDVAKTAATVVRSKYTTAALGAVAVAFPAVGGPALLAQQAAARAAAAVETAKQAKNLVERGVRTVGVVRAAHAGSQVVRNVQRLAQSNNPAARMAIAALQSVRA